MTGDVILSTNLPLPSFKKGKVRDLYDLGDRLLIVSTDRISAFDVVLPTGIPHKGAALNRLSAYWFDKTKDIVPNHVLEIIDPRTALVKKTQIIKAEFVVRGYLYGSAWENYSRGKTISGVQLPDGLYKAEQLPEPILTPTTKAEVGHDVEMSYSAVEELAGRDWAKEIRDVCLKIYKRASSTANAQGIIIADTKMEFGILDNELVLVDELLTPDSSRFWDKEKHLVGQDQSSFDKQYVRDFLLSIGWNKRPPAPQLPDQVVQVTSKKYVEAYEHLTGRDF